MGMGVTTLPKATIPTSVRQFMTDSGVHTLGTDGALLPLEIITPPYLLASDGSAAVRPIIVSSPHVFSLGETFSVEVSGGTSYSFVLMRYGPVTHGAFGL